MIKVKEYSVRKEDFAPMVLILRKYGDAVDFIMRLYEVGRTPLEISRKLVR